MTPVQRRESRRGGLSARGVASLLRVCPCVPPDSLCRAYSEDEWVGGGRIHCRDRLATCLSDEEWKGPRCGHVTRWGPCGHLTLDTSLALWALEVWPAFPGWLEVTSSARTRHVCPTTACSPRGASRGHALLLPGRRAPGSLGLVTGPLWSGPALLRICSLGLFKFSASNN